jgi:N6-adenosine-specific RNA methylase IME4
MSVVAEEYPQLKELMKIKDELNAQRSFNPVYLKCDLRETVLSPQLFGTKFDAILIDPPMEEYVRRAPGVLDPEDYWTWEEIRSLRIEDIADSHSFVFLWVGSVEGLEEGRLCFKKWGFRRVEDICWLKTNHENTAASETAINDRGALFKRTKEHCLMGIKNTIPPHLMHPNIDVDVIVTEEPPYGLYFYHQKS